MILVQSCKLYDWATLKLYDSLGLVHNINDSFGQPSFIQLYQMINYIPVKDQPITFS
jgi:hypothetical protein